MIEATCDDCNFFNINSRKFSIKAFIRFPKRKLNFINSVMQRNENLIKNMSTKCGFVITGFGILPK